MKKGWQNRPLADFVTSRPGNNKIIKGRQSDQPSDGLVQGFSASGPDGWVGVADYNQPGVVISAVGARCGKTFFTDGAWTAIANTHVLLPGKDLDPRWLWYRTNDEGFWLKGGAAQPFVKVKDTLQQPIPVPPLMEQQRIVGVLDEAFAGLATAQANAARNLQNARALFESYLEAVFTQRGSGWVKRRLSELCDIKHGYAFEGEYFSNQGDYVLLTPGNFYESGGYRDRGEKQKYFTGPVPSGYVLTKGDMLVAMTEQAAGLLGSPIIVPEPDRFLHNQRLGLVIAKPGVPWVTDFFFHVFNLTAVRQAIHDSASGTKVRHTSPSKIGAVPVWCPALAEQQRIATQFDALAAETQRLTGIYEQKQAALSALKKSLLHQAFAGGL